MSLTSGTLIGPYEILGPLGAGGMGEVFRARDTRLARDVAIKALPAAFAQDPARLARFEREAKLLASLSHPNIAGILGLEEEDGARYLVLECIEGETLAARLANGPLPLDEACDVARQVAAGLEAAHENGVVHRDLKPGNVMITPAGDVKVLDFGLAKGGVAERAGSDPSVSASPTMTYGGTEVGVVLGTAAYMSPEQARGRPVDKRSDIWSFGCLLYECLVGRATFGGETISDTIASILTREPDLAALPSATPGRVRTLLERCLSKDPRERLRDIGEARIALGAPFSGEAATSVPVAPAAKKSSAATSLALTIFASILAAVVGVVATRLLSRPPPPEPLALSIVVPKGEWLDAGIEAIPLAIAPDGRALVYASRRDGLIHLYHRPLGERTATLLPGTEGGHNAFLSPDGEWVAFFARSKLQKVSIHGGMPVELADTGADRSGAWPEDGSIVYSPTYASALYRIPSDGGTPVALTVLDSTMNERTHRWPLALPGGKWIVFTIGTSDKPGDYETAAIGAVSTTTGERRLLATGNAARFAPPNRLIVARGGSLYAQTVDPKDPRGGGTSVPVFDGVVGQASAGGAYFDIARNGTLVLVPGRAARQDARLAWFDLEGHRTIASNEPREYNRLDLSPDGRYVLADIGPGGGGRSNVHRIDLERDASLQVTHDDRGISPLWMPDGRHALWVRTVSPRSEIRLGLANGSDSGRVLYTDPSQTLVVTDVAADGSALLFAEFATVDADVYRLALDGATPPEKIVSDPRAQAQAVFSPDMRWVAYLSDDTGQRQVWVRPLGHPGQRILISREGGNSPVWAPDGRTLYFGAGGWLNAATLQYVDDAILPEAPRRMFSLPVIPGDGSLRDFTIDPSGQRFLVRLPSEDGTELREIAVMPGWAQALGKTAKAK